MDNSYRPITNLWYVTYWHYKNISVINDIWIHWTAAVRKWHIDQDSACDLIIRSMQAVCEADMQYGVKFNPKPRLTPQHQLHVGPVAPYLTLRTDLQCESQTCGSQSGWPPEATYSHCLTTMPSSGFQHSLGGQSPSRKSGVITLFWPQRHLPSLIHHAHDTHTPIPTVQNTYTREQRAFDLIWFIVLCIIRTDPGVVSTTVNSVKQTTFSEAFKHCESFFVTVWMLGCF